jgi:hypothetical protein
MVLQLQDAHIFSILDGYTDAVSNRTTFPLSNGVISMNSEHPQWTGTFRIHIIHLDDPFNLSYHCSRCPRFYEAKPCLVQRLQQRHWRQPVGR